MFFFLKNSLTPGVCSAYSDLSCCNKALTDSILGSLEVTGLLFGRCSACIVSNIIFNIFLIN